MLALAMPVPWEKARAIRLLNYFYQGNGLFVNDRWKDLYSQSRLLSGMGHNRFDWRGTEIPALREVRAELLKVALALYQIQKGKPAATLEDLVTRYLPEVPLDPIKGTPFHYRISKGEPVLLAPEPGKSTKPGGFGGGTSKDGGNWEDPNLHFVPAGQGIIWTGNTPGGDGTYLVPQWPKAK